MDLFEAIRGRRSIRAFKPDPIPDDVLNRILEAACWAPSVGNLQPWEFVVAKDPVMKGNCARLPWGWFSYYLTKRPPATYAYG
ncbi:MAG: nitroreductase family protein [Candidatus Bathyarchaeia archaeon]